MSEQPRKKYGIYGNIVSQKGDPDILETSEDSIQERFGLGNNDEDLESTNPYMEGGES